MTVETRVPASEHPAVLRYGRHVNPAFVKLLGMLGYGRLYERARGASVWDHHGNEYTDFLSGFGSVSLGHNHPRIVARLKATLDADVPNLMHVGPSTHAGELAEALAEACGEPFRVTMFSSSGSEAVEAAIKLARSATRRPGTIYCANGFHGTNLGSLSLMGTPRMRKPFEPLLDHCTEIPFGDIDALRTALRGKGAAAFVVEPIQAEGGVVMPPDGYLAEAAALCRKHGTLLVCDEVQTGLARTGDLFAFAHHDDFRPDVVVLAKALSGGLVPVAATVTSHALHHKAYGATDRFDLHGSTFAPNPLSCVAGTETLNVIRDDGLVAAAEARGRQLLDGLRARIGGHPFVKDIRGRGLLVGIELGPTDSGLVNRLAPGLVRLVSEQVFGQWMALKLLERGFICQPASLHWNVLRLEPPLIVTPEQIDQVVDAIGDELDSYPGIAGLLKDVSLRVGKQLLGGWSFGGAKP